MNQENANLPLIQTTRDQKLPKLQADFNAKIKKISELKESIENVKLQAQEIKQRIEKELTPIEKEWVAERVLEARAMEEAHLSLKLSKKDQETLTELIIDTLWDLIENFGQQDLIPFYNQYNPTAYEDEKAQMEKEGREQAFSMFEFATGRKVDEFDLGGEEDMDDFERIHRLKSAYEERLKREQWEREQKKANRKKSAKQEAKERKMKEEAELLTKSSRAIYMELAKELHPDRELDEQKKVWKTELLQKITAAYNANDLYELLRLRLAYKQSEMNVDSVPEEQLELYIKVLKEQISALQNEYNGFFSFFNPAVKYLLNFGLGKNKQTVTRSINREKKEFQEKIKLTQEVAQKVMKDAKLLKEYLKEVRYSWENENSFGQLLDNLMGSRGFRG